MEPHEPEYPFGITLHPVVDAFFKEFFRISDTPGLHDEYTKQFTETATFILASRVSHGTYGKVRAQHAGLVLRLTLYQRYCRLGRRCGIP